MTEKEKPGDVISANISGSGGGQIAVGKGITQEQVVVQSGAGVTEADLATLRQVLADLRTQVEAAAPPDRKRAALERVEELEKAVTSKEPDLTTMEYVKQWFVKNVPALAGSVVSIVVHPIVGRLVEAAGGALVTEFNRRFGEK